MSADLLEMGAVLSGERKWALVHGDNVDVLPMLPDRSVGHVITDPPYSEHVHTVGRVDLLRAVGASDLGFAHADAALIARTADEAGRLAARWTVLFCDAESVHAWRLELARAKVEPLRVGAWVKPDAMPQLTGDRPAAGFESIVIAHPKGRKKWNGGGHSAVWTHPKGEGGKAPHPTTKPLALMLDLVAQFTDPDDLVLDPFAGSGTTGVACLRLGRRFIGIERDAAYAAIARERLEAESMGLTLRAARAGQLPMFGGGR